MLSEGAYDPLPDIEDAIRREMTSPQGCNLDPVPMYVTSPIAFEPQVDSISNESFLILLQRLKAWFGRASQSQLVAIEGCLWKARRTRGLKATVSSFTAKMREQQIAQLQKKLAEREQDIDHTRRQLAESEVRIRQAEEDRRQAYQRLTDAEASFARRITFQVHTDEFVSQCLQIKNVIGNIASGFMIKVSPPAKQYVFPRLTGKLADGVRVHLKHLTVPAYACPAPGVITEAEVDLSAFELKAKTEPAPPPLRPFHPGDRVFHVHPIHRDGYGTVIEPVSSMKKEGDSGALVWVCWDHGSELGAHYAQNLVHV